MRRLSPQAIHCGVEGMNANRSAGAPLSSPAAAQRCAAGAGLDSGVLAAAQSATPSIAPAAAMTADMISHQRCRLFDGPARYSPESTLA
jgi:hypothetical protein